ncbi:unnamed protein product, partial [Soboliphyme baturini]|uniref:Pept_C1 domain-containing protein n=1 Tax=Soboliphyme baturini TaxID=241478 RepID=A0A183IH37_9BILA
IRNYKPIFKFLATRRKRLKPRSTTYFIGYAERSLPSAERRPACVHCKLRQIFDEFKKKFHKKYKDKKEEEMRILTFQESLCLVDFFQWRLYRTNLKFEANEYSDWTYEEFLDKFTGIKVHKRSRRYTMGNKTLDKLLRSVPKAFSWLQCNVTSAVRSQGPCGSCYAFSSVDLASTQYNIDHKIWEPSTALSPQYITVQNKSLEIPTETCYPYKMVEGECQKPTCTEDITRNLKIKWAKMINATSNEKEILSILLNRGPFVTLISVPQTLQLYKSGIIRRPQCQVKAEHAVMIVGYNYTSSIPYYIVKNTWGKSWGEGGFFRIEAGTNTCGVAQFITVICTAENCANIYEPEKWQIPMNSMECRQKIPLSNVDCCPCEQVCCPCPEI